MAVPLLTKKIVKKRVKQFKRPHSDRYIGLKVVALPLSRRCLLLCDERAMWSVLGWIP
jgi:large subunit ribosomal protein L32e